MEMRPPPDFKPYIGYFSSFYSLLSDESFLTQELSITAYTFYINLIFNLRPAIPSSDYYTVVYAIGQMLRRWELPSSTLLSGIELLSSIVSFMNDHVKSGDSDLHRSLAPAL